MHKTTKIATTIVKTYCLYRERERLDRRCLDEGHMRYAVVDVMQRYPTTFTSQAVTTDLVLITPVYYEAFCTNYAGKYSLHNLGNAMDIYRGVFSPQMLILWMQKCFGARW